MGPQGTSGSVCRHAGLWRVTRGEGAPGTQWVEASDGAAPRGNEQDRPLRGIVCPGPGWSTFRAQTGVFLAIFVCWGGCVPCLAGLSPPGRELAILPMERPPQEPRAVFELSPTAVQNQMKAHGSPLDLCDICDVGPFASCRIRPLRCVSSLLLRSE